MNSNHHRWAKENPDLDTGPVPTASCFDEAYYQKEKELIFRKSWLLVGRVEDVPSNGDYFTREIKVADASILVVRGRDGVVRAFHNVCPHRGNQLVYDQKGCVRGFFTCAFHSWGFDTAGRLRTITDEENFFDLNKEELGLSKFSCDVWGGFIFINLDSSPRQTLGEYLGGVPRALDGFPLHELRESFGYRIDENANWKIFIDGQNEVYHAPYLHASGQAGELFAENEAKVTRLLTFRRFGRHEMFATAPNPNHTPTPTELFVGRAGPGPFVGDAALTGNLDFYVIFPNTIIAMMPGGIMLNYRVWPVGPERTEVEVRAYIRTPKNAGEALVREFYISMMRDTFQEDALSHEKVQCTLKSGAIKNFMFQDEEIQLRNFHRVVEDHVTGMGKAYE